MSAAMVGPFTAIRALIETGALADLSAPEWKVLSVLIFKYRQRDGTARPGQKAIMRNAGMCESQVRVAIRNLRSRGIIQELQRGKSARQKGAPGIAAVYQIPFPIELRKTTDHSSPSLTGGKPTVGKPGHSPVENRPPTSILVSVTTHGVSKETMNGGRKTTGEISVDDLTDPQRLAVLFDRCAAAGLVRDCEADRVDFFSAAAHATRKGTKNPAGMFAATIRKWSERRNFSTVRDEEAGRRLLAEAV